MCSSLRIPWETRSPGRNWVTSSPIWVTIPTMSRPMIKGNDKAVCHSSDILARFCQ